MSECWETAEIHIRAERRLGELLAETERASGGQPYQKGSSTPRGPGGVEALTELGISYNLSSRAQSVGLTNQPVGYRICGMAKNKPLTITEVARRGGLSTLKKHGRKKMREWGKLGGRPPKKGR